MNSILRRVTAAIESNDTMTIVSPQKRRPLLAVLAILAAALWPVQSLAAEAPRQLLIASDLHFNPFADLLLIPDLAAAPATRWETILNRSTRTAYSRYGEDTNWPLLQSALSAMQATLPHPALIMITGDLLAHGFPQKYAAATHDSDREHYRLFVLTTVTFIAAELRRHFPGTQILITPGNNDDECGDYTLQADGPYLNDTALLSRQLAHAGRRFTAEWKALGSYTLQPRRLSGIRILSVNTVFFSNKYRAVNFAQGCAAVDSTAAARTFTWLESNLAQAKAARQKVWLVFHIPPGIDGYSTLLKSLQVSLCQNAIVPLWKPEWTARFNRMLADYQTTIAASFAGHTHTDDFRILDAAGTAPGFVLIDPPISPVYGQNPAYRVVSFQKDGSLSDQSTYYLAPDSAQWTREYTFTQEWQSPRLDAVSLLAIYHRIADDPQARAQWLKLLNVSIPAPSVPDAAVKSLDCAIAALDPAAYQSCWCPR